MAQDHLIQKSLCARIVKSLKLAGEKIRNNEHRLRVPEA